MLGHAPRQRVRARAGSALLCHVVRYVLGFVIQLSGATDAHAAKDAEIFHSFDPSNYPATLAVADAMPVPLEEEFRFGLELIINGLSSVR